MELPEEGSRYVAIWRREHKHGALWRGEQVHGALWRGVHKLHSVNDFTNTPM